MSFLKRFTYKTRIIFLIAACLLFFLIAWKLAIKRTIALKNQCGTLSEKLISAERAPKEIAHYKTNLELIENKIGENVTEIINPNELLLEKVSKYCQNKNIRFYELPKSHIINETEFVIETNKVVIEGRFIKLLKLLYQIETERKYGKIISADFESEKDLRTGNTHLYLTIYLQNIRKKKSNENV